MALFTNVSSQVSSWFGGVGKKGDLPENENKEGQLKEPRPQADGTGSSTSQTSIKGSIEDKNEGDSSATEGADSHSACSTPESPKSKLGEEGDGAGFSAIGSGIGDVSNKAIQGAKHFGSFLFSAVNKAGKNITEAGAKIKKTVEETTILSEFNKEQEAFIKDKLAKSSDSAVPPWVGYPDENALKEQIIALSSDRRNFVRSPPAGVEFNFNYESMHAVAMVTLSEDPSLQEMRFELVPKVVSEENFWRNYFYRVSLICQSSQLSSLAQESVEGEKGSKNSSRASSVEEKVKEEDIAVRSDSPVHEFVSDSFQASSKDLEEVKQGMKKLGVDKKENEEDWEQELQANLQEYEVVNDPAEDNPDWEKEIQQMLEAEEDIK